MSNKLSYEISGLNLVFIAENKYFRKTNGICEICKKEFLQSDEDYKNVMIGKCGHPFHTTCLNEISKGNDIFSCPIDNIIWESIKKH